MQATVPDNRWMPTRAALWVGALAAALLALSVVPTHLRATVRDRTIQGECFAGAGMPLLLARVDLGSSPVVTSPATVSARRHVALSPSAAQLVLRKHLHRVVLSRIGGLYGP